MKMLLLALALVGLAAAGRLEKTYLPPPGASQAGGQDLPLPIRPSNNYLPPQSHTTATFKASPAPSPFQPAAPINNYLPPQQSPPSLPTVVDLRQQGYSSSSSSGSSPSSYGGAQLSAYSAQSNLAGGQGSSYTSQQGSSSFGSQSLGGRQGLSASSGFSASSGSSGFSGSSGPTSPPVAIIKQVNENNGDGTYSFSYETEDGIQAQEQGQLRQDGAEGIESVQGSFSYTGPDNVLYSVTYTADENGFQAYGDHLPTPPPIPEAILRSLEMNAREEAEAMRSGGQQGYEQEGQGYPSQKQQQGYEQTVSTRQQGYQQEGYQKSKPHHHHHQQQQLHQQQQRPLQQQQQQHNYPQQQEQQQNHYQQQQKPQQQEQQNYHQQQQKPQQQEQQNYYQQQQKPQQQQQQNYYQQQQKPQQQQPQQQQPQQQGQQGYDYNRPGNIPSSSNGGYQY